MIKRIALAIVLLVVVAIASAAAYSSWPGAKHRRAFDLVALGATEAAVRELAGTPSHVNDGTFWEGTEWPGVHIHSGCVKALWYAVPWIQMYLRIPVMPGRLSGRSRATIPEHAGPV